MNDVKQFFSGLFDTDLWPPRWRCGTWSEFHGWLYIISDLAIWGAYFAIPLVILRFIEKKNTMKFQKIYYLFAIFILACGLTHLIDALTFWFPMYRLSALVRFITAVVSWLTVYYIIKKLPMLLKLRTEADLKQEIEKTKDISEELVKANHHLLEQQAFLNTLIASSIHSIAVLDPDLTFVIMNKTFHGYKPEDMMGRKLLDLFPMIKDQPMHKNILSAMNGEKRSDSEHYSVIEDKYFDLHYVPIIIEDRVSGVMVMSHDITELVKIRNLHIANNRELESAKNDLEQFVYIASHDLQEPLRKIKVFVDLIYHSESEQDKAMYFNKIIKSSERMGQLIQDTREYSRIMDKNLLYKTCGLNDILNDVLTDFELKLSETNTNVQISKDIPEVYCIPEQLTRLFTNLLSNSIKYNKSSNPSISISWEYTDSIKLKNKFPKADIQGDKFIQITWKDNGIGFDEENSDKIFSLFQRLHNREEFAGTGLGLAIVKKIIDNHMGYIFAESIIDDGATFYVILPVIPEQQR